MAYALVLGTKFCGFESHHQYQLWQYSQVAKAPRSYRGKRRFKSYYCHQYYGGVFAPAGNLVLKTSGTRDGMGIDTSLRRQYRDVG